MINPKPITDIPHAGKSANWDLRVPEGIQQLPWRQVIPCMHSALRDVGLAEVAARRLTPAGLGAAQVKISVQRGTPPTKHACKSCVPCSSYASMCGAPPDPVLPDTALLPLLAHRHCVRMSSRRMAWPCPTAVPALMAPCALPCCITSAAGQGGCGCCQSWCACSGLGAGHWWVGEGGGVVLVQGVKGPCLGAW